MQTKRHHRPAAFIFAFYIMMAVAFCLVCVFVYMLQLSFRKRHDPPAKEQPNDKKT